MMLLFCVASVGAAIVIIYSNIIALYEDIFNIKYRSVMLDCRGRLDYLKKCMYDKSPNLPKETLISLATTTIMSILIIIIFPYIYIYIYIHRSIYKYVHVLFNIKVYHI